MCPCAFRPPYIITFGTFSGLVAPFVLLIKEFYGAGPFVLGLMLAISCAPAILGVVVSLLG